MRSPRLCAPLARTQIAESWRFYQMRTLVLFVFSRLLPFPSLYSPTSWFAHCPLGVIISCELCFYWPLINQMLALRLSLANNLFKTSITNTPGHYKAQNLSSLLPTSGACLNAFSQTIPESQDPGSDRGLLHTPLYTSGPECRLFLGSCGARRGHITSVSLHPSDRHADVSITLLVPAWGVV